MATSTLITDYVGRGTHAARPATPPVGTGCSAVYYETDTLKGFMWDGSAWHQVTGVSTLAALSDVALGSLSVNDVLTWNGSDWINAAGGGGGGGSSLSPVTWTSFPADSHGVIKLTIPSNFLQADQTFVIVEGKTFVFECWTVRNSGSGNWGFYFKIASHPYYIGVDFKGGDIIVNDGSSQSNLTTAFGPSMVDGLFHFRAEITFWNGLVNGAGTSNYMLRMEADAGGSNAALVFKHQDSGTLSIPNVVGNTLSIQAFSTDTGADVVQLWKPKAAIVDTPY